MKYLDNFKWFLIRNYIRIFYPKLFIQERFLKYYNFNAWYSFTQGVFCSHIHGKQTISLGDYSHVYYYHDKTLNPKIVNYLINFAEKREVESAVKNGLGK